MDRGDLANLAAFATVAEQRSFRAAAARLGVTRPHSAIPCGSWRSASACAC